MAACRSVTQHPWTRASACSTVNSPRGIGLVKLDRTSGWGFIFFSHGYGPDGVLSTTSVCAHTTGAAAARRANAVLINCYMVAF